MASPEEYFDNFAAILDLTYGHWKTAVVRAVTSLRLLDEMDRLSSKKGGTPVAADEIASECGTNPEFTYRVLRAASALLLVQEHNSPARSFTVTQRGTLLLERQEGSARGIVLFEGSIEHCRCWLHLEKCLQTGNKVVKDVFGEDNYFDAFSNADSKHKEFLKVFQQGMASISEFDTRSVLCSFDFSKYSEICDIGSGPGVLLKLILKKYPHIKGCISDLPRVLDEVVTIEPELQDRCKKEVCDFFESVPRNYEVYMMKHILHDWNDENCIRILKNVRECAAPHSTLLLLEYVLPGPSVVSPGKIFDLHMGMLHSSKERTEEEWKTLLAAAKWKYIGYQNTVSGQISVIQAQKE
ncbi:hypothetical protein GpartN1_g2169.t1 [Galdieria partita]|uniref:O-methyltransferase n=1 Tax=Galdieria partita TaxID=83374 RepID=A0A9C7PTB9_9RHOD|nr:hypothetical protein GpartN1_g2169.t1 [Galdieria partita]